MATDPNALIVEVEGGNGDGWHKDSIHHLSVELHARLAAADGIVLAAWEPVSLSAAAGLLAQRPAPIVPVLVGNEVAVRAAVQRLPLRGNARPILIELERGHAALDLANASQDDIVRLVRAALAATEADGEEVPHAPSAEVLELRIPRARMERAANSGGGAPVDINVRRTLRTILDWADAATVVLVGLWADPASAAFPVTGLNWAELTGSLDRLQGIDDAPMEEARRRFDIVRNMIAHPDAAATPFVRLAGLLGGDELALKLLMVVLAPELDIRFQRLFGALQDDPGRRQPSLGLASAIVAAATEGASARGIRAQISALDALRDFRLVEGMGDRLVPADTPLRIDAHLLDWLVSGREDRLTVGSLFRPVPERAAAILAMPRREAIDAALRAAGDRRGAGAVILAGSDPGWIGVEAAALAGAEIRIAPCAAPDETLDAQLRRALRAARLTGRALVVDLSGQDLEADALWRALAPLLGLGDGNVWAFGVSPARLLALAGSARLAVATLPPVSQADRVAAAEAVAGPLMGAPELAARFRLPLARLDEVAVLAGAAPDEEAWRAAFRDAGAAELPPWVRRVPPTAPADRSQLGRVVLPETQQRQLETIVSHVEADLGGLAVLFAGESGTGKTCAAHAIAGALGVDVYAVDLGRLGSPPVDETEKVLDAVFSAADRAGAVLLFDEAEPLFASRGKLRDARDRHADLDAVGLVRRMEHYRGLAILALAHGRDAGAAFARGIAFAVDFPMPGVPERERIWQQALPPDRLAEEVDFALAARRLELAGGSIRRIAALAGAGEPGARIRPDRLQAAARNELVRLGHQDRLALVEGLFGPSGRGEADEPVAERAPLDEAEISAAATLERVMRLVDDYPHPAIGRRKVQAMLRGLSGRVPLPDFRE
jgi:hypothetical protein